jgi:hypothetical protein
VGDTDADGNPYTDTYPDALFDNLNVIQLPQATLLIQSYNVEPYGGAETYTSARCKVSQKYVESRVNCSVSTNSSQNCTVVSQRPSQIPHVSSNVSFISWSEVFDDLSNYWPAATNEDGQGGLSDLSMYYINNTSVSSITAATSFAVLDNIPESDFEIRLSQILNSYLLLGQTVTAVTNPTGQYFTNNVTSPAVLSNLQEIYIISWAWAAIFFIAILALICAAIATIILGQMGTSPELLGYCASAMRDSKYVTLPRNDGVGVMNGMELARQFKDKRVKFGIVGSDDGYGVLGIGDADVVEGIHRKEAYL